MWLAVGVEWLCGKGKQGARHADHDRRKCSPSDAMLSREGYSVKSEETKIKQLTCLLTVN
jgi:hypothetical protein